MLLAKADLLGGDSASVGETTEAVLSAARDGDAIDQPKPSWILLNLSRQLSEQKLHVRSESSREADARGEEHSEATSMDGSNYWIGATGAAFYLITSAKNGERLALRRYEVDYTKV
jgi:hypothetical protein